ncbi:MAG: antibiotic biosynthesis monooxygenase [Verrucomicrobiota bacterium]
MSEQVYWLLETSIVPGKLEELRKLVDELVAATREETGVIDYLYHLSPDGTTLHIFERFKDSAATLVHMQTFGKFAARFAAVEQGTKASVYAAERRGQGRHRRPESGVLHLARRVLAVKAISAKERKELRDFSLRSLRSFAAILLSQPLVDAPVGIEVRGLARAGLLALPVGPVLQHVGAQTAILPFAHLRFELFQARRIGRPAALEMDDRRRVAGSGTGSDTWLGLSPSEA